MNHPHVGRALAVLDFNRDGKTDWIVSHINEPSALLINQTENSNHWLRFRLAGTRSERDACGTRLDVTTASGTATRWLTAGDGYLARNEAAITIGLGTYSKAEQVRITWPNGAQQAWQDISSNQSLFIVEEQNDYFVESYEAQ